MSARSRPNILLLFPDQWRGDCLEYLYRDDPDQAHGSVVETPFLNSLANDGVTFRNAYSSAPVCIPARASLTTGRRQANTGLTGYAGGVPWRYEDTLMHCLRDGGYQTLCVGKTHFYPQRNHLGFEEMRHYSSLNIDGDYTSDYERWLAKHDDRTVRDTIHEMSTNSIVARPWEHPEHLHPNSWTIDATMDLLDRRDPTRPFFMHVGFHRPHPPFDPPVEYYRQYQGQSFPDVPVGEWAEEYAVPVNCPTTTTGIQSPEAHHRTRAAYYAQLSHIEAQIGRLFDWLRDQGLFEETYILFLSDHGELLGDHHHYRKSNPLEGSAHVPWIVKPSTAGESTHEAGTIRDEPVTFMDVMPSFLDAANVEPPVTVDGRSINPLLRGESMEWRPFIHGELDGGGGFCGDGYHYLTDGSVKFIWESVSGDEWFFDLVEDPNETTNRAGDPEYEDRVAMWRTRLVEQLEDRPEGFSDGTELIPRTAVPTIREEFRDKFLSQSEDADGVIRPLDRFL